MTEALLRQQPTKVSEDWETRLSYIRVVGNINGRGDPQLPGADRLQNTGILEDKRVDRSLSGPGRGGNPLMCGIREHR